ncbi:transcriptional repressor [Bernardetia sp. MNP-M8]|jgi:Fur family ferric uptake transcriptional regulator|uniref:Fur family transcriptional regulator n=1 Tax=Bernardetia sp. MNP-M8 TaxID=3127470 RepID=UPI0030D42F09
MVNKKLEHKLESKSIKPTAMRLLILQYLIEQTTTVSLSDIEMAFERSDKSTIFRTLKTFEKSKLIHSIEDGTGHLKYALCLEGCSCSPIDLHYHFHCNKCKETFCLTTLSIPYIELPKNFEMQQANMVIKGICANCKI